ncbi:MULTISPECIES: hypothetical protein [unclassified Paenibacillus]
MKFKQSDGQNQRIERTTKQGETASFNELEIKPSRRYNYYGWW